MIAELFELQPLAQTDWAHEKADALLVLLTAAFTPATDTLSNVVAQVLKSGDLPAKPGQLLDIYRPARLACARLILLPTGDTLASDVRKAVAAAVNLIKGSKPTEITLFFSQSPSPMVLRVALTALADASYVFTTTKPKADARTLAKVKVVVPDAQDLRLAFEHAVAAITGIEMAKEWGNRPANHATPAKLAQAARSLARLPRIKCKVRGPKEVAKLGMGAFEAVAQGSDEPLRLIGPELPRRRQVAAASGA
ncbi:MAG: leucyl aminopeptidase, partial [Comamonadaceae bacterium]|nr:leucyl aminopeptidase [Comamonadaceae bacterium]